MREWLVLAFGAVVLAVAGYLVAGKERILQGGETVYLALAPVDPRSLMQGDYMALRYEVAVHAGSTPERSSVPSHGHLVLAVDERGVARFERYDRGQPLGPDEVRLRYRIRDGGLAVATDAYFFQEGTAAAYREAEYGILRVASDGRSVLVGLADDRLNPLGRRASPGPSR